MQAIDTESTRGYIIHNLQTDNHRMGNLLSLPPLPPPPEALSPEQIELLSRRVSDTFHAAFQTEDAFVLHSKREAKFTVLRKGDLHKLAEVGLDLLPEDFDPLAKCRVSGEWLALPYDGDARVFVVNLITGYHKSVALFGKFVALGPNLTFITQHERFAYTFFSQIHTDNIEKFSFFPRCTLL